MSSEFAALLDLLQMLVLSPRTGVLIALLAAAAAWDAKTGRIPNWLVYGGALYALAYNSFFPLYPKDIGAVFALEGLGVGLAALLPLYLLRAMGAGDVKLMAMVGAFLGPRMTVAAVLATLVAGGLLSIAVAMRSRRLGHMVFNLGTLTLHTDASAGRMPYGLAIAAGSASYLVLAQLGYFSWLWS
jgi:prepilin peptidase CpaA